VFAGAADDDLARGRVRDGVHCSREPAPDDASVGVPLAKTPLRST
jgi:hypothetical protein